MAADPDPLDQARRWVVAHGEEPLGSLLTAGERALQHPTGLPEVQGVWWVPTRQRSWLVAVGEQGSWAVSAPSGRVELARGWTRDELIVGELRVPLRTGTRQAATRLLERATAQAEPGPDLPATEAPPGGRAPVARGGELPDDLAQALPADPDERWLLALQTATAWPVSDEGCAVRRPWLWIAVSDARIVLAAPPFHRTVHAPVAVQSRAGRTRLNVEELELTAPLRGHGATWIARLANAAPGPDRWAEAAQLAVERGRPADAVALIVEAARLGRHERCWPLVGRLLATLEQTVLATAAVARAISVQPDLDIPALARSWEAGHGRLTDTLKRASIDRATLVVRLTDVRAQLPTPSPPDGLPWPPQGPLEVCAAALALLERFDEADRLVTSGPPTPRALAARAALRTAAQQEEGARAWTQAAIAQREAGDAAAIETLERAIALGPAPDDLWRRAAWAWPDPTDAEAWWTRALQLDPEGGHAAIEPLPVDGERALAAHATALGSWKAAADAWRRVQRLAPDDEEARDRAAELLASLELLDEARHVWEERLAAIDDEAIPSPRVPRWRVAWQIARHHAALGETERGLDALVEAVGHDYLKPDAWAAALDCPGVALPDDLQGWWAHIGRLLAGEAVADGAPLPGVTALDDAALDALHPGGGGWLERLRTSFEPAELPSRAQLTRGLQRLDPDEHPRAAAALRRACAALDLPPPDAYLFRGEGAWGASAWSTDPPVVLLGARHLRDGERHLLDAALTCLLSVELAHIRCRHPILSFETDLIGTSRSAYQAFGRYAGTAESVVDLVSLVPGIDQLTKLQKVLLLTRRVFATRSALDKATGLAAPLLSRWGVGAPDQPGSVGRERLVGESIQLRIQADRAALLVTGDLRAAVDAILKASSRSVHLAARVEKDGLAAVLASETDGPTADEAVRLSALIQFAATLVPGRSGSPGA